ncbi:MAG: FAD-binding oxidoreductase [Chitinophagales bacterium]|nr:FAD-binding oxidoreductase [Chitinophagales bacterium]
MKVDFLVIGQGIAGSWLTYFLHLAGASFRIIDKSEYWNASAIASGIINPITGRRFVKTWLADELVSFADEHYSAIEKVCDAKFYSKEKIFKALHSNQDLNEWSAKAKTGYYQPFLASDELYYMDESKFNLPFGCFHIDNAARIDSHKFLSSWRSYLELKEFLISEEFSECDLSFKNNAVQWKGIQASKAIFCQGYRASKNSLFDFLPFAITKGECLHVHAADLGLRNILSSKISVVPLGDDLYYIGATSELNDSTLHPTSKMYNRLIQDLNTLVKVPYEVKGHYVGIRPTVKDRRPFLGQHPQFKNLYIFNGMGTKGYSLAPYFANKLLLHLTEGKPIDREVDIGRYQEKYENA